MRKTSLNVFEPVKDEQLQKDFQEANAAATGREGIRRLARRTGTTATDDFALGTEKFSRCSK